MNPKNYIFLLLVCGLLASCQGGDTPNAKPTSNVVSIKHEYPKEAADIFIRACESEAKGDPAYCQCALDKVQRKYTYEEFSKVAQQRMQNEEIEKYVAFGESIRAECQGTQKGQ